MAAAWDKLPDESQKAYAAFCEYYKMPPQVRSIAAVARKRGVANPSYDEKWSAQFQWVERATAYDEFRAKSMIEVIRTTQDEAQKRHIEKTTLAFTIAGEVAAAALKSMYDNLMLPANENNPDHGKIDTKSFQRLVRTTLDIDTGMRRALGLPTVYKTERVEETDAGDEEFYFVGAAPAEDDDE